MRFPRVAALAAGLAVLAAPGFSNAYVIDGRLADWGIVGTGRATDWTPSRSVRRYVASDQTGGSGIYLGTGYGGQRYDAEAAYLDWDSDFLYVLVVTGLSPDTPQNPAANSYGAGDLAIDFGRDGTFDYAMVVKSYAGLTPGTVYRAGTWNYGIWSAPGMLADAAHPSPYVTALKTGTAVGVGKLAYAGTSIANLGAYASDRHYVIEAALPLSSFGANWSLAGPAVPFDLQWTMYCANDIITVDAAPGRVPEPAAPILIALAAAVATRRYRAVTA